MFVGVGAARVRDMFENAKKHAPCIVFIDEIDAVGRQRGAGLGGGNDEREQTLNQLLVEMDGFEANSGVIIIAATNRPDVLDPALMRPGRFDRQVVVPLPDIRGRDQILQVHMRKVPIAPDVKADILARGTPGFSGADLANLVNEAALFAARGNKRLVDMEDFERAKDKIIMGAERRSMVMTDIFRRAVPWTQLILESHDLPVTLNLDWGNRLCGAAALFSAGLVPLSIAIRSWWPLLAVPVVLLAMAWMQLDFYQLCLRRRGVAFAFAAFALHWLFYLYSTLTFAAVVIGTKVSLALGRLPWPRLFSALPKTSNQRRN